MKPIKIVTFAVATIAVSLYAFAEPEKTETDNNFGFQQLIGEEMLQAYENKTMEGIYNSYAYEIANNIPPETFTETHHDNATSTYTHRGESYFTTTGVYTVKREQMCYFYNDPPTIVGRYCFYVYRSDNCYYHFSADEPKPTSREDFENWTSMAYRREDANNCLPDIS